MRLPFTVYIDLVASPESGDYQRSWQVQGWADHKDDGAVENIEVESVLNTMDSYPVRDADGKYPETREWELQPEAGGGADESRLLWINQHMDDYDHWQDVITAEVRRQYRIRRSTPRRELAFSR